MFPSGMLYRLGGLVWILCLPLKNWTLITAKGGSGDWGSLVLPLVFRNLPGILLESCASVQDQMKSQI